MTIDDLNIDDLLFVASALNDTFNYYKASPRYYSINNISWRDENNVNSYTAISKKNLRPYLNVFIQKELGSNILPQSIIISLCKRRLLDEDI